MPPTFGTSGLRGLVTDLTAACVTRYVHAFISACPVGTGLYVGHDLRASSPALAQHVREAAQQAGGPVVFCGAVPTPALALAASGAHAAAIMVTGSHIPADRNGLKFYTPQGEITKTDERRILQASGRSGAQGRRGRGPVRDDKTVNAVYAARYRDAYGPVLDQKRIGLYMHSAVGRDMLLQLLQDLGADVVPLGRSDIFMPVDTEAVAPALRVQLRDWARAHDLDAIVSTDADGDRPLLTDQHGTVVAGDILGQITAHALGADHVVTPVSSNSAVSLSGHFADVTRTKIGSPHVIAGMQAAEGKVAGYEANGGFLLGFAAEGPKGPLSALMTRDALLPLLAVLTCARRDGVAALINRQPQRFTATDRLAQIDPATADRLLDRLATDDQARQMFLAQCAGKAQRTDQTDGLRMILTEGRVVHLRRSGNAPELRVYIEAETPQIATGLLERVLQVTADHLAGQPVS